MPRHRFAESAERHDVYTRVTEQIAAALEKGVRPWAQPWSAGEDGARIMRPLRHTGEPYNGINVLTLWATSVDKGFTSPRWMTFNQAIEHGGCVMKGEKGAPVVYASTFHKVGKDEGGTPVEEDVPVLKHYTVFNVQQIGGLPEQFYDKPPPRLECIARNDRAEEFFRNTGADIRYGGAKAYYHPADDYIRMPPPDTFRDAESFYATLAHETVHWTKHETRLDRDLGKKKWGDPGYAFEEIVADIGAAYACADLDLTPEPREETAAYIGNWLKALNDDKHFIFRAAAHAQKAADYLVSLQPRDPAPDTAIHAQPVKNSQLTPPPAQP